MASSSARRTYYSAQAMQTWYRPGMDVGDAYGMFTKDSEGNTILASDGEEQETGLDPAAAAAAQQSMIGGIFSTIGDVFTAVPAILGFAQAPKTREHELSLARLGLKTEKVTTRGLSHQADIAAAEAEGMATSFAYVAGALVIAVAIGGTAYVSAQKRKG